MLLFWMKLSKEQPAKWVIGWPQFEGLGVPPDEMSDGMELRGKYQTWMLPWFQNVA